VLFHKVLLHMTLADKLHYLKAEESSSMSL
jgi:hypothetical protein